VRLFADDLASTCTQLGIESPAYQPGPYSTRVESYVENFTSWYVERLRAHGY